MADEQPLLTTPDGAKRIVQAVQQTLDGEVQTSPLYTGSSDPRPTPRRRQGIIPVLVTQNGGSAGANKSAVCSWTYDLYHALYDDTKTTKLNSSPIALAGYGNGWRGLKLALTAATRGEAYLDASGMWKLTWVDESPSGEQDCS